MFREVTLKIIFPLSYIAPTTSSAAVTGRSGAVPLSPPEVMLIQQQRSRWVRSELVPASPSLVLFHETTGDTKAEVHGTITKIMVEMKFTVMAGSPPLDVPFRLCHCCPKSCQNAGGLKIYFYTPLILMYSISQECSRRPGAYKTVSSNLLHLLPQVSRIRYVLNSRMETRLVHMMKIRMA